MQLTKSILHEKGQRAAAVLLGEATEASPTRALKIRTAYRRSLDESDVSSKK